jgi:hypothetical protein
VRIPNVKVSALIAAATSGADLVDLMIQATHKVPNLRGGKPVFYGNETIMSFLDRQTKTNGNMNLTYGKDEHGKMVTAMRGIPVQKTDALLDTEAFVAA